MTFRFDLTDLRLFLNTVEAGSITGGADRLHLSLASASARILGMEDALGTALLIRERRGVSPTPAGHALVRHARTILVQVEQMRGELGEYARGLKGLIRLLCNTAALHEHLPEALGDYLVTHPNVNINAEERDRDEIVMAITDGTADVGIVDEEVNVFSLQTFPFRPDRLALVTPRDHPLAHAARSRSVSVYEASNYDVVGLLESNALQARWEASVSRWGKHLNCRFRAAGFHSQCQLVAKGVGISLMPETAARRYAESMEIEVIALSDPIMSRQLLLCVRRLDELPAYTRELISHLSAPEFSPPEIAG